MRVLLTNDDGIEAEGIQTLRRALLAHVPGIELIVVAPDGNRSAMARSITTRRPLWVEEVPFDDGQVGYATDGTPVDCVRLANLGLVAGWKPELVVSGINHGANLGDDITYSGTVAAAFEGVVLGIPGVSVSQQSGAREMDFIRTEASFDFRVSAGFAARLVADLTQLPLDPGTILNVNAPGCEPKGVTVAPLGRRIYSDALKLVKEGEPGRRLYGIYGDAGHDPNEVGTDLAAVAAGQIAITPLHLDHTHRPGLESLSTHDLEHLLRAAV
ncbi:MAG: 5'/3'-nucleotidase SurE [Solirubrobacterales bacterium]|nr:5'/3'-nucleotidase SurE [Solirubrobacterales bacterium]